MPNRAEGSLIAGRSSAPLTDPQLRSVGNTFLGFDTSVAFEHDASGRTRFVVEVFEGEEIGKIFFGSDVYPGASVADPNAALSMKAAVAHEICHYHRWQNATELPLGVFTNLDEALTSLDAVLRFPAQLSAHEIQQLVRDAVHRLQLLRAELVP